MERHSFRIVSGESSFLVTVIRLYDSNQKCPIEKEKPSQYFCKNFKRGKSWPSFPTRRITISVYSKELIKSWNFHIKRLTTVRSMFHFYNPGFLVFSGGIEMKHWPKVT